MFYYDVIININLIVGITTKIVKTISTRWHSVENKWRFYNNFKFVK